MYIVIYMASLIFCPGNLNMANPNGPNIAAKKKLGSSNMDQDMSRFNGLNFMVCFALIPFALF